MTATTDHPAQKIAFIHLLRGICAAVVVWSHLVGLWLYDTHGQWLPWTLFYNYLLLPLHLYEGGGRLAVVTFFLISGYVISMVAEREGPTEFLIKRAFRIFPMLFISVAALAFLNWLLQKNGYQLISGTNSTSIVDYFLTATLMDRAIYGQTFSFNVTWTLLSEFYFYAMMLMTMKVNENDPAKATLYMIFIFLIVSLPNVVSPYFHFAAQSTVYIPVFIIGRLIFLYSHRRISVQDTIFLSAGAGLAFIAIHEATFPGASLRPPALLALTVPTAILLFIGMMKWSSGKISRPFKILGDISYSLYLLHLSIGLFTITILHEVIGYSAALLLATVLTFAASWVAYTFIEKPAQAIARSLLKSQKHPRDVARQQIS
ncbi:acyltransferase [Agrobacterium tumefaciens]|uniref:acyltransferase family protein n=1 Tax=Agrobacterium tumefaciens TaxID=358 RepID=UPI0015743B05|nr:acyltransferase [Agrobacterium tumefaciens]NSZ02158.1 acyltransferase [Agrobacterium tumefaciens]NSZ36421.1 acyltransferase [Agrobacterium tumefaciens]NTB24229.1 acyltransferase [Agrobacterium tumefaciens]NTB31284.1 acyltransferase [Agrobacterium tumefaciens]NTB35024.1 acyltransferase [Agrobacterium tumefaciens]